MKVTFCDACGIECELGSWTFDPYVHIIEDSGYVDQDWNKVSGRREQFDLCTPCYNEIYKAAYEKFKEIKDTTK